jgi:hypothetical protein
MIRLSIPAPQGLEFTQWGKHVAEQLAGYAIQAPMDGEAWREWASSLFYEPQLGLAPSPLGFDSWQDWASSFRDTFS